MKYIIYRTTNYKSSINGKFKEYTGCHKTEDPEIFDNYIGCNVYINRPSSYSNPVTPFQYAVKKYGIDAFKREILYIFDDREEAFNKEAEIVNLEYIKRNDTYNVALGGLGGSLYEQDPRWHSKPIFQFDLSGNLIKKWESTIDAGEYYNDKVNRFSMASFNHTEFLGYFWSREENINIKTFTTGKKKFTYLYNMDGKFIQKFRSRTECSKYLGCNPQSVSNALSTMQLIKNHYVSDELLDVYIPKERISLQDKLMYIYSREGNFIGTFTGREVFPVIGVSTFKKLNGAFNDNNGWCGNFYISLNPTDKVIERNQNGKRKIGIYDKGNNLIEILDSLKEVKDKYNLNAPTLNSYLKGIKENDNYVFKYINDIV